MVLARLLGMEPVLKFYPVSVLITWSTGASRISNGTSIWATFLKPKISNGSLNYHNLLKVETKLSQKVIVETMEQWNGLIQSHRNRNYPIQAVTITNRKITTTPRCQKLFLGRTAIRSWFYTCCLGQLALFNSLRRRRTQVERIL